MFTPTQHAAFNAWANERLHAACAMLGEERLRADHGAYFKSILGKLNHILLVDMLYMDRLTGQAVRFTRLDETVCATFADLRVHQAQQDRLYVHYSAALTSLDLDANVRFQTLLAAPQTWTVPMRIYLSNLFQHQVHHRGQIHNLLSQASQDPPPVGFVEYAIEAELVPQPEPVRKESAK